MNFDKTKAMRDAERYLAQGKLRSAIGEYEQVIKNDPRDFTTLNILGDLYIRTSAKAQAVSCYTSVAEHYSNLGFAQKAIAIYNKIAKLEPNSVEVSAKLAELYKEKGSVREARSHYVTLAEHYLKTGKKVEALAIWKQIALLDPTNTDVFTNIAQTHLEEGETDAAVEAYIECAARYTNQKKHDLANGSIEKALGIKADDPRALSAFVSAKFAAGCPDEAVARLEGVLEDQPFNREVLNLLIDCQVASGDVGEAEKTVIKLVEQEPANYPKFLELAALYFENDDMTSMCGYFRCRQNICWLADRRASLIRWFCRYSTASRTISKLSDCWCATVRGKRTKRDFATHSCVLPESQKRQGVGRTNGTLSHS